MNKDGGESNLAREDAKRLESASGVDPRVEEVINGTDAPRLGVPNTDFPTGEVP